MNSFQQLNGVNYPHKHLLNTHKHPHISQIWQKNGTRVATLKGSLATVFRCVYRCLPHHLTPSGEGIPIKIFRIRLRIATVLMCLGDFRGGRNNFLRKERGLRAPYYNF